MIFGNGGGGSRGFGKGRMLIGLAIVAIGIFTYMNRTQVNPVTGEKQRVAMSVDQEKALGLQAAPEMAQQMGGALDPRKDSEAARVHAVGRYIVESSEAGRGPYAGNFNFYLLADAKTVNAFALPGGQIFITRALYGQLKNEAQLAGVLGHEIGHVINRHSAEHMATGQLGQMIVTGIAVGASDEGGRGQMAAAAAAMANQMLQMKYSRGDELESDNYGLKYMAQAGFDPSAMLDVMRILKEASGGGGGGASFMKTHPDPDARVEAIHAYLKTTFPGGRIPPGLSTGKPLR